MFHDNNNTHRHAKTDLVSEVVDNVAKVDFICRGALNVSNRREENLLELIAVNLFLNRVKDGSNLTIGQPEDSESEVCHCPTFPRKRSPTSFAMLVSMGKRWKMAKTLRSYPASTGQDCAAAASVPVPLLISSSPKI